MINLNAIINQQASQTTKHAFNQTIMSVSWLHTTNKSINQLTNRPTNKVNNLLRSSAINKAFTQ